MNNIDKHNSKIIKKGWGHELIFADHENYCGKILHFKKDEKTSMHFHVIKEETFYVLEGDFQIDIINTKDASLRTINLSQGEQLNIPKICPHQIIAHTDGKLIEVSTHDSASDSYRVMVGSSQEQNISKT